MSILDKIKNLVSVQEEEYYDDETETVGFKRPAEEEKKDSFYTAPSTGSSYEPERRNKVVNIHATTQLKVVLVKPERFEDAPSIADHLNAKRTVVLNLEAANKETSRRLIDFLCGVAYANQGQLKRVANSTFIITPFDVDIMGDLILDELESSNMYI